MSTVSPEIRKSIDGFWKVQLHRKRMKEENGIYRKVPESSIRHMKRIPYTSKTRMEE